MKKMVYGYCALAGLLILSGASLRAMGEATARALIENEAKKAAAAGIREGLELGIRGFGTIGEEAAGRAISEISDRALSKETIDAMVNDILKTHPEYLKMTAEEFGPHLNALRTQIEGLGRTIGNSAGGTVGDITFSLEKAQADVAKQFNKLKEAFGASEDVIGRINTGLSDIGKYDFTRNLPRIEAPGAVARVENVAHAGAMNAVNAVEERIENLANRVSEISENLGKLPPGSPEAEGLASSAEVLAGDLRAAEGTWTKTLGRASETLKSAAASAREALGSLTGALDEVESEAAASMKRFTEASRTLGDAQSILRDAEASLKNAKTQAARDLAETEVADAQEAVTKAKSEFDQASAERARTQELVNRRIETANASRTRAYQDFKIAENELKIARAGDAPEAEIATRQRAVEEARQTVRENGSFRDRAELKTKDFIREKFWGTVETVVQSPINLPIYMAETLAAGWLFMLPGTYMQNKQSEMMRQALLDTIRRPQQFGGIWMQIPKELTNEDDPLKSIFLYMGIQPGGECTGENLTKEGNRCEIDITNLPEDTQFFVSQGSSDFLEGWAAQPITSTNFSGKMINLNTGYTFFADGLPVDEQDPMQPLLPTGQKQQGAAPGSVYDFLRTKMVSALNGTMTVEDFNPSGDWIGGLVKQIEVEQTTIHASALADFLDPVDPTTKQERECPADGTTISPCPPILKPTIMQLNKGIAWGRGSEVNIWPLRPLTSEAATHWLIGDQTGITLDEPNAAIAPLYGAYVYETTFTRLGKQLDTKTRRTPGARGDIADYVVALDNQFNVVPILVPEVDGISGKVVLKPNKKIVSLYSLLDGMETRPDGSQSVPTRTIGIRDVSNNVKWVEDQVNLISYKQWYAAFLKAGPFTIGDKKLEIREDLAEKGPFVYTLDPEKQLAKGMGTLEDGSTDYFIALSAPDAQGRLRINLDISTQLDLVDTFWSLVSSRFYDKNLKPRNTANGYKDVEFLALNCAGSRGVTHFPLPAGCTEVQLGGKPGPYTAPLYSLYMDADINPYNKPALMTFMLDASKQVGTKAASLLENAFELAGVTESMMQIDPKIRAELVRIVYDMSLKAGGGASPLDATCTQTTSACGFLKALQQLNDVKKIWQDQGSPPSPNPYYVNVLDVQNKIYLPALDALAQDIKANGSAFAGLGNALAQEYSTVAPEFVKALNNVSTQLANAMWRVEVAPTTPENYNAQGRIYVSNQYALKYFAVPNITPSIPKDVVAAATTSWNTWKRYLQSTFDQWGLYADKGPFEITPDGTPAPVTVEATSVDDLKRGVYVYTSPKLPQEFLLIGSGTTPALLGVKFDVSQKSKTPYILSLSSGQMYQASSAGLDSVTDVPQRTPDELITLVTGLFKGLTKNDPLVQAIITSQASWREATQARREKIEFGHAFYRFNLLLDERDANRFAYVYQDITHFPRSQVDDPDPAQRAAKRDALLQQIPDFLTYAEVKDDKSYDWKLQIPDTLNERSLLVSLVSGIVYNQDGPIGRFELAGKPGAETLHDKANLIMNIIQNTAQLKAKDAKVDEFGLRKVLIDAINARVSREIKETQQAIEKYAIDRAEQLRIKGYPVLDAGTVTSLIKADFLPDPYPNLKFLNGKYYQVYQDTPESMPQSIFDYDVKATVPGLPDIGILYKVNADKTTSILTDLSKDALNVARATAGIIVTNGTQSLTIPHEELALDVGKIIPLPGFDPVSKPEATYELKVYNRLALVYVTPTKLDELGQKMPPYYLDLYSGTMFDQRGKPLSIAGYFAQKADDQRYLLVTRGYDGFIESVRYEDPNGMAYEYVLADVANNPSPGPREQRKSSPDGKYWMTTYIMSLYWDTSTNIKVVEYEPQVLSPNLRPYYEVTEQSAIDINETTGQQALYFNNPVQRFDGKGHFNQINYVMGDKRWIEPGYVLTTTDEAGNTIVEALIWLEFQSGDSGNYVVYKPQAGNFVANYTYTVLKKDAVAKKWTATIDFKDGLIDQAIQKAYGHTAYYNEITDMGTNKTYTYTDKLTIMERSDLDAIINALGVVLIHDYQGTPVLAEPLGSIQGINATSPDWYKEPGDMRDISALIAEQFKLSNMVLKKAIGATEEKTRYLYQVGSNPADSTYAFSTIVGNGNLIDLETGIGYNVANRNRPMAIISPTELISLRAVLTHTNVVLLSDCEFRARTQEELDKCPPVDPNNPQAMKKALVYFA